MFNPFSGELPTFSCPTSVKRCTFSDEQGPSAFHSPGTLPKSSIHHDDQSRNPSVSPFPLQDNDSASISIDENSQISTASVPLLHSTSTRLLHPPLRLYLSSSLPTTSSRLPTEEVIAPILLSNGKPLKPSLKHSRSMSMPSQSHNDISHPNSQPSTPISAPKTVHFPEKDDDLATVRFYNRSASPNALKNATNSNGIEIETDGEEPASLVHSSFPFYNVYEIDLTKSSPTPSKFSPHVNLLLESLSLTPSPSQNIATKPFLTGFLLVRNLAFEKQVFIRFTLDDWQTVSEVSAHYVDSLSRFPSHICSVISDSAWDDCALQRGRGWDRFAFIIHLEDCFSSLSNRTLWLASCYRVNSTYPDFGSVHYGPGGEWWDNNNGANYRVELRPATLVRLSPTGRPRCEFVHASIASRRTQPPLSMMCKEYTLSTMAPSTSHSETRSECQTERHSLPLCSKVRKRNSSNHVPPAAHVMLSLSIPPAGFPSLSPLATLPSSSEEDSPSPVSPILYTPSVLPTLAPRVIIREQIMTSPSLKSERREDDDKFRASGYVSDWDWSAPRKLRFEKSLDQHGDLSPVEVPPSLPDPKNVNSLNNATLDALVKQWCFAQGPSPTHGDDGPAANPIFLH